jgi:hypothetical protein
MPRKDRVRVHDDPRQWNTRPDTSGAPPAESEDTRVTRVEPVPPLSHPYGVLVARELPLYPGIPRTSSRNDEPTEPQAPQAQSTEHSSAPLSGTRNRGIAPELPPVPEQPPVPMTPARARELERMLRLVTPLPTNEWTVGPSVHEWNEDWGVRPELAVGARERGPSRIRLRTLMLVVGTLLAAAVVGTALGDTQKVTRVVDRVTELVRGAKPEHTTLPLPVKPRSAAPPPVVLSPPAEPTTQMTSEPPLREEAPAVPTMRIGDLPLLAVPAEEESTLKADRVTAKPPATGRVTAKPATTRKQRPARRK